MSIETKKKNILELCSESEHGSWEFWSTRENKTDEECEQICDAIIELVNQKMIFPVEHKSVKDQSYTPVKLDSVRLQVEVKSSMIPNSVNPDNYYWFVATDEGMKQDIVSRNK